MMIVVNADVSLPYKRNRVPAYTKTTIKPGNFDKNPRYPR